MPRATGEKSQSRARRSRPSRALPALGGKSRAIEGVHVHPLRRIPDERGVVMHMLRRDDPWFLGFGEIYFSMVYPGVIKAWHLHSRMTLNYAVVQGTIKLVLYDDREGSPTRGTVQEIFTGGHDYELVTVPPRVWNGFKGVGVEPAIVANCPTEPHDPDEIRRLDPLANDIPYDWGLRHG
ncbi:MAG: dTDP-4-dehydrorhamnose 3,5-epimerase family protein [Acidobacteriota bacterium]